jgi:hypothetical protein
MISGNINKDVLLYTSNTSSLYYYTQSCRYDTSDNLGWYALQMGLVNIMSVQNQSLNSPSDCGLPGGWEPRFTLTTALNDIRADECGYVRCHNKSKQCSQPQLLTTGQHHGPCSYHRGPSHTASYTRPALEI